MTERMQALVVGPGEGTRLPGPAGGDALIRLRTEDTAGSVALIENVIGPRMGPPLHVHAREDELWYILEGSFRFRADEAILSAQTGSLVFVPRGTAHCFQNLGDTPARIMVMFMPSGMERFFEQHAALLPGPVDPALYAEIASDNWMTVAGPPLGESHPG